MLFFNVNTILYDIVGYEIVCIINRKLVNVVFYDDYCR